mgnify:CR=1 FL=1
MTTPDRSAVGSMQTSDAYLRVAGREFLVHLYTALRSLKRCGHQRWKQYCVVFVRYSISNKEPPVCARTELVFAPRLKNRHGCKRTCGSAGDRQRCRDEQKLARAGGRERREREPLD